MLRGGRAGRPPAHRPGRAGPLLRAAPRLRPRVRPRGEPAAAAGPGGRRLARAGVRPVQRTGVLGQRRGHADRPAGRLVRGRPGAGHPPGGDLGLPHAPAPRGRGGRHGRRRGRRPGGRPGRPAEPRRRSSTASSRSSRSSAVGAGLRRARDMLDYADAGTVAAVLGCGRRTSAHDTVPFALWSAARALGDYEEAFWTTAQVGGDVDTNCAIVGGVRRRGEGGRTAAGVAGADGRRCRSGCLRGPSSDVGQRAAASRPSPGRAVVPRMWRQRIPGVRRPR